MGYGIQENWLTTSPLGSKVVGGVGKIITGAGNLVSKVAGKDIQIIPGGLGAQMQTVGGYWNQMNPFKPPSSKAEGVDPYAGTQSTQGYANPVPEDKTKKIVTPGDTGGNGGGGGGGGGGGDNNTSGPSAEDKLRSEVASIFDPVFSALSGQENTLQSNYGITQEDINQQYNTSSKALASQNERGINQLNELGTEAGKTKEDALTAATRLYNELTRGGQQRFGGASSAGEAYGALTAVEQQRRQGTIQSAYDSAMAKVASYKNDLISKYQDAVAQLESEKDSALRTARQQFNDAWQAIQNAKNQAQSDKAAATLSSLNDYRNKVYTINMNAVNFAQTLAANKDASLKYVDNITQQVVNSLNSGSNAIATLGTQATGAANNTTYGKIGGYTAPTTAYTGQIQSRPGQKWDPVTQSWVSAV